MAKEKFISDFDLDNDFQVAVITKTRNEQGTWAYGYTREVNNLPAILKDAEQRNMVVYLLQRIYPVQRSEARNPDKPCNLFHPNK